MQQLRSFFDQFFGSQVGGTAIPNSYFFSRWWEILLAIPELTRSTDLKLNQ
jgi:hypothetical protein